MNGRGNASIRYWQDHIRNCKKGFQFISPMYGFRCSRKRWHRQHNVSKRFVFLPCLCLAVMVPWLEGGPYRIYAFTFCLLLPPYCAEFGELRLTLFSACCHQGRAWARAAPYLTQPVLSTEAVKRRFLFSFLLKQPGRASHNARTVPAQCPHSARNSARTVPAGKNCMFVQTRQQESLLR